jgi:RNA polymerase sigma-70 factor (ECF subfamily)
MLASKYNEGSRRALIFESAMQDEQRRIAFEIFYAEHAAPVYRFALRLCGDRDDAEDLAAEALTQAFRKGSGYRGDASERTWLCAIVVNQWRMLRRRRPVSEDRLDDARHLATTLRGEDIDLANAIASLSDPLREAFLLVKGEGFTHAEAAKVARVPVGTMYFRVHTAVRQLREKLTPSYPEGVGKVAINHEM